MTACRSTIVRAFLAQSEDLLALIGRVSDGIAVWEPAPWRVVYANEGFWRLTGKRADEWAANPSPGDALARLRAQMASLLDRFRDQGAESSTLIACPETRADCGSIEICVFRVRPDDDRLIGMIVRPNAGDLSQTAGLNDTARRDPLTGLPDRAFLMERLSTMLTGERVADRHFAVVFLDLDNFKQVNDEFGHLIGDDVLREAARRIAGCLREGDIVARFGGDEFVALVGGITDPREVEPVVVRIHMALAKPIAIPGGEVALSLSAGMALASEAGGSPEELLAVADRAMYAAKRTPV
jgi:diguanylate cyclase (GGDEF)-like protein